MIPVVLEVITFSTINLFHITFENQNPQTNKRWSKICQGCKASQVPDQNLNHRSSLSPEDVILHREVLVCQVLFIIVLLFIIIIIMIIIIIIITRGCVSPSLGVGESSCVEVSISSSGLSEDLVLEKSAFGFVSVFSVVFVLLSLFSLLKNLHVPVVVLKCTESHGSRRGPELKKKHPSFLLMPNVQKLRRNSKNISLKIGT